MIAGDEIIASLRRRREHLRLTRRALSLRLGYSEETVRHWEYGHNNPSFPSLLMWAEALGMDILVTERDDAEAR